MAWEQLESSKELGAQLDGDYTVIVREVADFDAQYGDPDHVLVLLTEGRELFAIDRRDVSAVDLGNSLGESVEYSYGVFAELWRRALMKATKLDEHLSKLNRLFKAQSSQRRR